MAKCEGFDTRNNYRCQVIDSDDIEYVFECYADDDEHAEEQALNAYPNSEVHLIEFIGVYSPSTDWSQGGPIIEREAIEIHPVYCDDKLFCWEASGHNLEYDEVGEYINGSDHRQDSLTPLIAAMRCYVTAKLGDKVEIPDELF